MIKDLPPEVSAAELDDLRKKFENGHRAALISAMCWCAMQQIAMPEWVAAAFLRATREWYGCRVRSLDEAFGVQLPKGTQLAALRKKRDLQHGVHADISSLHKAGRPINKTLFREVGARYGIGATLCEEYYRSAHAKMQTLPPGVRILLDPYLSPKRRTELATRKVSKFRGSRSET